MSEGPLRHPLFRVLWLATLVSNVGTWMQEVANGWLMTTLAPSPLMVALVQTATTLPMFLLALPAGALADVLDRRKLLLATQTWMMLSAAVMAILTLTGAMTPTLLLICTFWMAVGAALNSPGWHAVTPEIVPKPMLPAAVTLNGLAINCAKAIGPGLGGIVVVSLGPGFAFVLNALSFLAVVFVLWSWNRRVSQGNLPTERFVSAMRVGIQHVIYSPVMRHVLMRSGLFVATTSSLWGLLPLLCKQEYGFGAREYGLMLVLFGVGAILGATLLLPRLRARFNVNEIVGRAWLAFVPVLAGLAVAQGSVVPFATMLLGGVCSICLLSSFHLAAQSVSPAWVRARAMSVYLLTFYGASSFGSLFWGYLAQGIGVRSSLLASSGVLLLASGSAYFAPLRTGEEFDLEPSLQWPEPETAGNVPLEHGPVMVTVEYNIPLENAAAFRAAMDKIRRTRYRNGVLRWGLFVDLENPTQYREVYLEESWAAHLRQHERVTQYEVEAAQEAYSYHQGDELPKVFHYGYCDDGFPLLGARRA
jgi:MFS family permease